MIDNHPQFRTDESGKKLVVLTEHEFEFIMSQLEDLEDIRLFDEANGEDDGTRILLSDYLEKRRSEDA